LYDIFGFHKDDEFDGLATLPAKFKLQSMPRVTGYRLPSPG
jgi:hypothetical protein